MSLKDTTVLDLGKYVILIGGVLTALYGGGVWVYNTLSLVATKEYHDHTTASQLAPVLSSVEQIEASVLVPRIKNILNLKCSTQGNIPIEVDRILERSIARYEEIEKRTYNRGLCKDGKHYTTYEIANGN